MFLLIRGFGDVRKCSVRHFTFHDVSINTHHTASDRGYIPVFTFHDVSINTSGKRSWTYFLFPLHSTMFLLILVSCFSSCALSRTLHSTMFLLIPPPRTDIVNTLSPLHSTMFLLILSATVQFHDYFISFTFHDVSINTARQCSCLVWFFNFTFHDVSINTNVTNPIIRSFSILYIPRCFY